MAVLKSGLKSENLDRNNDIPTKFWKKFVIADCLDRRKMVKKLMRNMRINLLLKSEMPLDVKSRIIETQLIGYFDDFADAKLNT